MNEYDNRATGSEASSQHQEGSDNTALGKCKRRQLEDGEIEISLECLHYMNFTKQSIEKNGWFVDYFTINAKGAISTILEAINLGEKKETENEN